MIEIGSFLLSERAPSIACGTLQCFDLLGPHVKLVCAIREHVADAEIACLAIERLGRTAVRVGAPTKVAKAAAETASTVVR